MKIENYSDDGFLYDVCYKMDIGMESISSFVFDKEYTEIEVEKILTAPPYFIKVNYVMARGYVLKMRSMEYGK